VAPRAEDLARCGLDPDEARNGLGPLVAPDLQVDVDNVVVGDGDLPERVRDRERSRLVARVEVPDDPNRVVAPFDSERSALTRLEIGFIAPLVGDSALGDGRIDQRLARSEWDVAVAEVEVARERDLEAFAYAERAVLLDVDGDVGGEQGEAVGARRAGEGESCDGGEGRDR
jgi:hypothetical protein